MLFEESELVVTDPREFTQKLVKNIMGHDIVKSFDSADAEEIQNALYKGISLKNSLEGKHTNQDVLANLLDLNEKSQTDKIEEMEPQALKDLFLRGLYFKVLHQGSFKENPQTQTEDDEIHYWSLLEKTGLGVQLTPLAMFIPLLITQQTGEELEKAASRFRAGLKKSKFRFACRYDVLNIAGNGIEFFHEFTKVKDKSISKVMLMLKC